MAVVGPERSELARGVDLDGQLVDEAQAGHEVGPPWLRDGQPSQELPTGDAEQIRDRHRMAEGHERGVDAVLERCAMADKWSRKRARSRSARTPGVGQPDLRHQVPTGQLGQHPRIDLVGLGGQRAPGPWPSRVSDRHVPAVALERVVDEAGAGHRLDHGAYLLALAAHARRAYAGRPRRAGPRSPRRSGLPHRGRAHQAAGARDPIRRTTWPGASRCWFL